MDLSQGQGSSQENIMIIQATTPSVSSANAQSTSIPSSSMMVTHQQEMQSPPNIATAPIPQLVSFFHQLKRDVMEAEKNLLEADNFGGEAADPRQQIIREKLDNQKQLMLRIRDIVSARTKEPR
jgi:hypothetical protein